MPVSSHATSWAWKQDIRPAPRKFVLLALVDFADARGCCRVSQPELAELTGQSERAVRDHLKALEMDGFIRREDTRTEAGFRDTDAIHLNYKAAPAAEKNLPADSAGRKVSQPEISAGRLENLPAESAGQEKDLYSLLGSHSSTPPINTSNGSLSYQDAMTVLAQTPGMLGVWRDWVRLDRLPQVSQEAQVPQWAAWIQAGSADALRAAATEIITSGSWSHPWGGLKHKMSQAHSAAAASAAREQQAAADTPAPLLQPGERRSAPDGREWTVAYSEWGFVYFEETTAPDGLTEREVLTWPLTEGSPA